MLESQFSRQQDMLFLSFGFHFRWITSCFLIQPENIVCVSKDSWDIKVIDFGLAQELVPGVRMTALKGTPEFMGKLSHTNVLKQAEINLFTLFFAFFFSSAPEAVNFEPISLATDMWWVQLAG